MKHIGAHIDSLPQLRAIPAQAHALGANAFAFCPSDPRSLKVSPVGAEEARAFIQACSDYGFTPQYILPHATLLLNLCSPDGRKLAFARNVFVQQLKLVASLGLDCLNFHPGSHLNQLDDEAACRTVADSINYALDKTEGVTAVVENMAGQGTAMGATLEQIGRIVELVHDKSRVGVCIDTCHAFAAGYDLGKPAGYDAFWQAFDALIGAQHLRGMHINDSLKPLGSRVDRHAPIGQGELGSDFFKMLMADPRTDSIPLILETPDPALWHVEIDWLRAAQQ